MDDRDLLEDIVYPKIVLDKLTSALPKLDDRERKVIILRFGLMGYERLPDYEIARRLGISRSYVLRISKRGIDKLKRLVDED